MTSTDNLLSVSAAAFRNEKWKSLLGQGHFSLGVYRGERCCLRIFVDHISAAETGSAAVLVIRSTAIASATGRSLLHFGRSPIGSRVGERVAGWRVSAKRCAIMDSLAMLQSSRVLKITVASTNIVEPARICLGPQMVS